MVDERDKLEQRARPGQLKTVTYRVIDEVRVRHYPDGKKKVNHIRKNHGLPEAGEVELRAGYCPCSICGHEYMHECEGADCKCCSSVCT